ncbi:MAG TPA: hypothetical protein VFG52_04915, partial [Xanthomonadales bacterium]|nr:hypothetical protein [Xanthomonadales bacterium]
NDASRLAATIRSRCQSLPIRPPAPEDSKAWLQGYSKVGPEEAGLALQAAANSPLQAALLLQQGRVDDYRNLLELLQRISQDSEELAAAYDALFKLEPTELWHWLAVASAEKLRSSLLAEALPSSQYKSPRNRRLQRHWAGLYQLANRNHKLLSTPVRKDLLLRDWLIQWSAPTGS